MLCLYNVDGRRSRNSQERLQLLQGVAVDGRCGHHPQPTTRRRFKHPCGDFYASASPFFFETAPTQGLPSSDEQLVHGDRAAEPGMPWITDVPPLRNMSVELSTSIIGNGITRGSATG
jgi:hypothetical protein